MDFGRQAAQVGKPINVSPHNEAVAAWLVQRNLAARTSDGGLVLLSCSLQTVTELEKPMLVTGPEDSRQNSLWGLRRRLQKSGWSQGSAATASAQGKIFNFKNSFKQYWCLLLDRSSAALDSWTTVIFITANVTLSRSRLPNLRDATKDWMMSPGTRRKHVFHTL